MKKIRAPLLDLAKLDNVKPRVTTWFYLSRKYFVCTTRENMETNRMTLLPIHDFFFRNFASKTLGANAKPGHDSAHGDTRPRFH